MDFFKALLGSDSSSDQSQNQSQYPNSDPLYRKNLPRKNPLANVSWGTFTGEAHSVMYKQPFADTRPPVMVRPNADSVPPMLINSRAQEAAVDSLDIETMLRSTNTRIPYTCGRQWPA